MGNQGIIGRVRGTNPGNYPENREEEQFHITSQGDQLAAFGLPKYADIVRHGDSWQIMSAAFTALTAVPTTVGIIGLWNGEPDTGKSYLISHVGVVKILIDTTQIDHLSLWATLMRAPVAAITDATTILVGSLSGRPTGSAGTYDGRARKAASVTTITGRWDSIGTPPGVVTAIAGTGWWQVEVEVMGQYIVPPGGMFAVHCAELTATASKLRACIRWHEMRLPVV